MQFENNIESESSYTAITGADCVLGWSVPIPLVNLGISVSSNVQLP
jgi:hypothetical protein